MLQQINDRLMEIQEKKRRKEKLESLLDSAEEAYRQEKERLDKLKTVVDREKADVDRLEGLGLTALFCAVLGGKEERLKKERQEFLRAKLERQECQDSVNALQEEMDSLVMQIGALKNVDAQYADALKQKERFLVDSNTEEARSLFTLSEKLGRLQSQKRELDEAVEAGYAAQREMAGAVASLQSAGNWGVFDMMGGGLIATAVKHSKMDKAQGHAHLAQQKVRRFQRELKDVQVDVVAFDGIDVGSFMNFADYFFDGLIVDWMVQSRINTSRENVQKASGQIMRVLAKLEQVRTKIDGEINQIARERLALLERV